MYTGSCWQAAPSGTSRQSRSQNSCFPSRLTRCMADAPTAPTPTATEGVKVDSRHLRGALSEELVNDSSTFTNDAQTLLKFHGTYAQDNRDVRRERTQKRE